MAFEILAGSRHNVVGIGSTYGATPSGPVSVSAGTLDASFPLASLYDGLTSQYARFSNSLNAYSFDIATNLLRNGDGEESTAVGWTALDATLATSATHAYKGAKSLKVTNGTLDTAGMGYQHVTVQAGQALAVTYAIGWPTAGNARLAIYDTRLARYLDNAGAWSNAVAYVASSATGDFAAAGTLPFSAPSVTEWGGITGELEVRLISDPGVGGGASDVYAEVLLFPTVDFIGIFGHNIPSNATITLTSYADWWASGAATVRATFSSVLSPVAWYCCASPLAYPFYRLTITYPNSSAASSYPYIGELVLGKRLALTKNPDYPVSVEPGYRQSRQLTPAGVEWASPLGGAAPRRVTMPFDLRDADRKQVRDYVQRMTRGGIDRCVLVPTEVDSELCLRGRIAETGTYGHVGYTQTTFELALTEDPMPIVED